MFETTAREIAILEESQQYDESKYVNTTIVAVAVDGNLARRRLEHPGPAVGRLAHRVGPHHRHGEPQPRYPVGAGQKRGVDDRGADGVGADVSDVVDRDGGDRQVLGDRVLDGAELVAGVPGADEVLPSVLDPLDRQAEQARGEHYGALFASDDIF